MGMRRQGLRRRRIDFHVFLEESAATRCVASHPQGDGWCPMFADPIEPLGRWRLIGPEFHLRAQIIPIENGAMLAQSARGGGVEFGRLPACLTRE